MTARSLRQLIADVLTNAWDNEYDGEESLPDFLADALLASPVLAAIIDLAAVGLSNKNSYTDRLDPEVRALLTDWRAER